MTLFRLIAPEWAVKSGTIAKKVLEGVFTDKDITKYNNQGYNVYYLPNAPTVLPEGRPVDGTDIDQFNYVFADMDIKDGVYSSKDEFYEAINIIGITPTKIIDSGNGVHIYWKVTDLDAMSYLRFQRRIAAHYMTDSATTSLFQLMRYPGTLNTKVKNKYIQCEEVFESDASYTCEELDKLLPAISPQDEQKCQDHYNKVHNIAQEHISDVLPPKFGKLLQKSHEAKELFSATAEDRSKGDYRLGHLMFANGFTREEALSVLVNCAKALNRAPAHRRGYAQGIVDKIWTYEETTDKDTVDLSYSVKEILQKSNGEVKGTPFRCHKRIDNTEHGFRLSQVIGLVAGSGVGKTAMALNMFRWFVQENPNYHHFFIPLEQPANEIADRWKTMCGNDTSLHDKVHVISNYDDDGNFRHLSFDEIKDYIEAFKEKYNLQIGCIVIDHIGALKKKGKNGENQDLMDICHAMKAFAVQTNTLLVMQSQSSREKAGIGDLELNKDAAYGTMYFEAYCDFLITMWQPLKRCHADKACPTVTAFKFCKIRHKKARKDIIQEDVCYWMYFDTETEQMRDLTQDEITSFKYFLPIATNKRKNDRKTEIVSYQSVPYKEELQHATIAEAATAKTNSNRHNNRH